MSDIVLHDLRHEGISRLFELGFQIHEVALVSGHTNWRTLMRYTHLQPASLVQREHELRALVKKDGRTTPRKNEPMSKGRAPGAPS